MTNRFRFRLTAVVLVSAVQVASLASASGSGGTTTRTKPFARPPYYQGDQPTGGARIGHLPLLTATPPGVPDSWVPGSALERLKGEIEGFLRSEFLTLAPIAPIDSDGNARAPTIYFGCALDEIGECDTNDKQNVLATTGGTRAWKDRIAEAGRSTNVDHVLVLELGLAPRWIHQKNLSGKKEVRLGSDYIQPLAWLTSLDSPVWVLQLTGALVDAEGKIVRSGAEGLWAVRTPFRASMVGAERLIRDDEVDFVRTELVREDLANRPLAWQAAVRRLVQELTTGSER